ncbi:MAG: flagellin [Oleiphilus sp.]|jgi:flagellin|nr:MAG: flagellin [Oleiphilus sp.]
MPQIINTNIASLNAQRNLNASQRDQDTALQRLSSGLRINSAKDDAAGLAISTRFDAQIRGTSVAARNAGDAISLAQTAEGALGSINSSLQRIRELALQSANDTNTNLDRAALQEEVSQLIDEIQTVADSANFNGKKLLDGSFQNAIFQTGANVGDTISVSVSKVDAESLGSALSAGISSQVDTTALVAGSNGDALVSGDIVINGVAVGASVGSDDTASVNQAASSAIAKAAAINAVSDDSGVRAVVNENVLQGGAGAAASAGDASIEINGVTILISNSTTQTIEQTMESAVNVINEKSGLTGVTASFDGNSSNGITLTAEDGRNITLTATAAADVARAANLGLAAMTSVGSVYVGNYTLVSEGGTDIALTSDTGNIDDNAGFQVGTFSGSQSGLVSDNVTSGTALSSGDLVINGVSVGPSLASSDTSSTGENSGSAIAKAAAINAVSDQTNVTAIVNENRINSGNLAVASSYSVTLNDIAIAISLSSTDTVATQLNQTIDAINAKSGQTGITAEALDENSFSLVTADGRNIEFAGAAAATEMGITADIYGGSVTLVSGGDIEIGTNTGNPDVAGLRIGTYGNGETGTALKDLDVTSVAGAEAAVLAIDNAVNTVASVRAELGAVQNRFQNTISNLEVTGENLNAANSRIRDADFAAETAALSKSQVLQQAGISVLAQANARPQQVLSLLQ